MFLLKKILTPLILPLTVCVGLLILGNLLLWFSRKRKTAKALLLAGTVLLVGLSSHAISDRLIGALEYRYPPLLDPLKPQYPDGREGQPIKWIFVLGGGQHKDPKLPPTSHLSDPSFIRMAEGIRLLRLLPGSRLILSGGTTTGTSSEAETMASVARQLGVDPALIVLETESLDTESQARAARRFVDGDRFILVTSAAHMPRAMALFRHQGLRPIPAPTDYSLTEQASFLPRDFFPSIGALSDAEDFIYERVGYLWSRLRGLTAEPAPPAK